MLERPISLEGQWTGKARIDGAEGLAIIDVDGEYQHFRGTARLFTEGEPGVTCEFTTTDKGLVHKFEQLRLAWIPRGQASLLNSAEIRKTRVDLEFPETASLSLTVAGNRLHADWESDLGRKGSATLIKSAADQPSEIVVEPIRNWDEFKKFALAQGAWKYIYRGQPEAFRLRTRFHRSHRKDLVKYVVEDIPLAYRTLTAKTKHLFDLTNPEQLGAFWNLLQHHGYPTPLLDWTYSPFVAAFFAYRRKQGPGAPSDKIRILMFDRASWVRDYAQLQVINFAQPHFSVLEALAIENARALPQQSLSTLTNVDDIESYIRTLEQQTNKSYLKAIDLPASQRREVMIDLSLMGITAGSLFPGLDGACEELYGRMFHP